MSLVIFGGSSGAAVRDSGANPQSVPSPKTRLFRANEGAFTSPFIDAVGMDTAGNATELTLGGQRYGKDEVDGFGDWPRVGIKWDFTSPQKVTDSGGADSAYNAFPHTACDYDPVRDRVVLIYTSSPSHYPSNGAYLTRFRYAAASTFPNLQWSDPIDVAGSVTEPGALSQSLAVGPNGRYYILDSSRKAGNTPGPTRMRTSDDGGTTWTARGYCPGPATSDEEVADGLTLLSSGRLIHQQGLNDDAYPNRTTPFFYSDDEGETFTQARGPNGLVDFPGFPSGSGQVEPYFPWETKFLEFAPGRVLSLTRTFVDSAATDGVLSISLSNNNGADWTPRYLTNIKASSCPADAIYFPEYDCLEILAGSRSTNSGETGLYQNAGSLGAILLGKGPTSTKVLEAPALSVVRDFGYPGICRISREKFVAVYFAPSATATSPIDIWCGTGTLAFDRNSSTGAFS